MQRHPFHYGTPVEGDQFTGRERELDALVSRMSNGINVVLLSPRRYGKTSLLLRAEGRLARARPAAAIVAVNVLRCRDLATLVSQLTTGVYHLPGGRWHRARQGIPEFARRLRLRPTVSLNDQGHPVFGFEANLTSGDADEVLADLYALLSEQTEKATRSARPRRVSGHHRFGCPPSPTPQGAGRRPPPGLARARWLPQAPHGATGDRRGSSAVRDGSEARARSHR